MSAALPSDWQIHFSPHFRAYPEIKHAVFDFDGTLSLVRGGWAEIMLEQFLEHLPNHGGHDSPALRQTLLHDILALNGKPTIHQMELLAEKVVAHGGEPDTPANYNLDFQRRLRAKLSERLQDIHSNPENREKYLVHEARTMLTLLRARGVTIHLLSGTARPDLLIESAALGISEFLGDRIYGPEDLRPGFTKRAVFEQIVRDHSLRGEQLMCFGDGAVEIMDTCRLGGLAIALASDEVNNGSGIANPDKKGLLLQAGAHAVIPDYRHSEKLVELFFNT